MKRIVLLLVFVSSFVYSQSGELNALVNAGIVQGESKVYSSYAVNVAANYLFDTFEDFKVGPTIGVIYFNGKSEGDVKADASMYLPIGASATFQAFGDEFFVGGDIGYAIGLSPSGVGRGLYFKPMLGYNLSDTFKLGLSYSTVRKKHTETSFIGLNLIYNIFGSGGGNGYYTY